MASSKALIFAAITLISAKTASSFPTAYEPERNLPTGDSDRLKSALSQQELVSELYSALPCSVSVFPQDNHVYDYTPLIVFNSHGHYCVTIEPIYGQPFASVGKKQIIESPGYPNINSYPNNRYFIYKFVCPSGENPVIDLIEIRLQQPIPYMGSEYCVDLVRIEPSIDGYGHPHSYCGNFSYTGPFFFSGTTVHVMFRTSPNDNAYQGFHIELHCQSSLMTEMDAFLQYLQHTSKLEANRQESYPSHTVQFDSDLAKLVDFASHQCKSATALSVVTHWNIFKLALQYEKVDDEELQRAAQDVLQCFSPSKISFARNGMDETK